MARMGRIEKRHMVDGEWVTIREVSERLGVSKNSLWTQMARRGVSLGTTDCTASCGTPAASASAAATSVLDLL